MEVNLELEDMQGLIARGYDELKAATFFLLHITSMDDAKRFVKKLLYSGQITPAKKEIALEEQKNGSRMDHAIHIAFTSAGLKKIGLLPDVLKTFSREFLEGMNEPFRSHLLGDVGHNAPANWDWAKPGSEEVHIMLLCYATDADNLKIVVQKQKDNFSCYQLKIVKEQPTHYSEISREHFGFRDGISTPVMEGLSKAGEVDNPIKAGEFVLGYLNEYKCYTDSPRVKNQEDELGFLPKKHQMPEYKDLGKNGTYLVYRQISQDVYAFWDYLKKNSKEPVTVYPNHPAIKLAAKLVGRWPGGSPLATSGFDDPDQCTFNDFTYSKEDPDGLKCPFGAHIRRTNPRDQVFAGRNLETSNQMVRKHQILRRGRIYGEPLVKSMKPEDLLKVEKDDGGERGLHFICLVGHISRQFEFIQNVWINNPTFADMSSEVDPIVSPRQNTEVFSNNFTCQGSPVNRKYKSIPTFTRLRGGEYFFMPGINALHFIAGAKGKRYKNIKQSNLAKEHPHPEEALIAQKIIHIIKNWLLEKYDSNNFLRAFHAKSIGLVKAQFEVEKNLPAALQRGLFKKNKTYNAWVRFSNASPKEDPDDSKSVRGMAIKILGTDESPVEEDALGNTQDIILTNNKILFPGTVAWQVNAMKAIFSKPLVNLLYRLSFLFTFQYSRLFNFLKGRIKIANVLEQAYYSSSPYLFGEGQAIKWQARPLKKADSKILKKPNKDFLRERLSEDLYENDYSFELLVQFQQRPEKEPIEDASAEWKTPFIKVGTIKILKQDFNTTERGITDKEMLFSPWHSMNDHRPLGGVNRIRREVYNELSSFRKRHNKN